MKPSGFVGDLGKEFSHSLDVELCNGCVQRIDEQGQPRRFGLRADHLQRMQVDHFFPSAPYFIVMNFFIISGASMIMAVDR